MNQSLEDLSLHERLRLLTLARAANLPRKESEPVPAEAVSRAARPVSIPLSFAQERLWFVDQLNPDAGRAYQLGATLRLEGELDSTALRRALDRIVLRHEVLRTVFRREHERTVQVIVPSASFSLLEKDLSELGSQDREGQLARETREESESRFDLSTGPLIRGRLLKLSEQEHVLVLTTHHIVSDGWSIGVLMKELSALYTAYRQGAHDPLPELPVQYVDYTLWQRQRLQGPILQEQLRYWRESLQGAPELLSLPTDETRPARASYRGDSVSVQLEESLSKGLRELSHRHGTTLFMTLYSGFAVLLSRLSGQQEVVIGTPMANRVRPELEELIGLCVNMLALRCRVNAEQPVSELLREVKRQTLSAYSRAEVPFEQIVEALQPHRSLSYNPIFQVGFTLQNTSSAQWTLPGLELSAPGGAPSRIAAFDLMLSLQEAGGRIVGVFNYAQDLFERETIERWLECLRELLWGMVRDDQQAVGQLPLLNERQREQVLRDFNTPTPGEAATADGCIHEFFQEVARHTPDVIAVVEDDQFLTYEQLDARSSRLASYLQARSVQPQERVVLWLPRSAELLLAQLAVLKCGATYVPLDIELPGPRQEFVLRDCAARHVLCWHGGRPCALEGIEYLEVERGAQAGTLPPPSGCAARSEWVAYVMYTSGSSGQPKGVEIPHRGIVRLARENGYARIGTGDRVAFANNPAFDASTFEVWGALANGATVRIVKPQELLAGRRLAEGLRRDGVSVLLLTVGLFNQYVTQLRELWVQLRYLLVGGDALDARMVRQVLRSGGPQNLLNGYGPTEATTFALTYPVMRVGEQQHSIPLGRPISQTRVYVLDEQGQPLPVGVWGEICIGGRGLARGYLGRPELTAERFVSDPFGEAGGRLYRSGDIGRWRADGVMEYQGRNDAQVKVRGYRVELGEIESQLREHEAVGEAVVLAQQKGADAGMGEKRLVAYVTAHASSELDVESLRSYLKGRLPAYMVPAAIVVLERFPLTTNGKVDRKALPEPNATAYRRARYEAPQGEIEMALAGIWQELLEIPRVGRHDNFFELGGHSLLAVQLVSRLRQLLNRDSTLVQVFDRPTLAELAHAVSEARALATVTIERADRSQLVPLSWQQERSVLPQLFSWPSRTNNVRDVRLILAGPLDVAALRRALDTLLERHEILRTQYIWTEEQRGQRIAQHTAFPLRELDLCHLPAEQQESEVGLLQESDADEQFKLKIGPLGRALLIKLAEDRHVFLVTLHRSVIDPWSKRIFDRELLMLYEAYQGNLPNPLEPLPIQYADYAAFQHSRMQGSFLEEKLRFWSEHLREVPRSLALPLDRPKTQDWSLESTGLPIHIDNEMTEALYSLSSQNGTTLFMTLFAAIAILLSRLSAQRDFVILVTTANRGLHEVEGLMGQFVSALPIRIRLEDQLRVGEILQRVREVTSACFTHEDLPPEMILNLIEENGSSAGQLQPQVLLTLMRLSGDFQVPGLQVTAQPHVTVSGAGTELKFILSEFDGFVRGELSYASRLFDRARVENWLSQLNSIFVLMTQDAQCTLEHLHRLIE